MDKSCNKCHLTFSTGEATIDCTCGGRLYDATDAYERLQSLAQVLAYESGTVAAHIEGFARVPRGVVDHATDQVKRLEEAALAVAEIDDSISLPNCLAAIREVEYKLLFEARVLDLQLEYKSFPASRRRIAEAQRDRLRALAAGSDPHTLSYHHTWTRALSHLTNAKAARAG